MNLCLHCLYLEACIESFTRKYRKTQSYSTYSISRKIFFQNILSGIRFCS